MRFRSTVLFAIVLLGLLALAVPAAAVTGRMSQQFFRVRIPSVQRAFWRASPQTARTADPAGPFALSGTVLGYDGSPLQNADVLWGWAADPGSSWWDGDFRYGGRTSTGDSDAFLFPAVTSVPGRDWLEVMAADGPMFGILDSWTNDFSAGQPYTIRPGRVRMNTLHESSRGDVLVRVGDEAGSVATSEVDLAKGTAHAWAAAPDFVTAEVQTQSGRATAGSAVGWVSPGRVPVAVEPGKEAATLTLDWNDAVHGRLAGPNCRKSGPAGSVVTFVIDHWPAGMQVSFAGLSFFGEAAQDTFPPVVTSAGTDQTYRVRLRLPADTPAGLYVVEAYRSDDPQALLDVYDYYLVSELAASSETIHRGDPVRLHGAGEGYQVTLFERTSPAPQPSKIFPPGWTKVRSFKTHGRGRFRTGFMKPDRTTWYVALYSGGDFPAYTQVVKVTVRNQ